MRKLVYFFIFASLLCPVALHAAPAPTDSLLEPWSYTEDFEHQDLGAWASYPFWQDLAYDQNFRLDRIVPGDPNTSIVEKVTPYTAVDNYAGAQHQFDVYLVPGATLHFRYYLKTNQHARFYKIRFAAGVYGKIDYTIPDPATNQWTWVDVGFDDLVRQNPALAGLDRLRVYALAFLAMIPSADPAMPIYLGLDDITLKAQRPVAFRFAEPLVDKLPEFSPYIAKHPYRAGDLLNISGRWQFNAHKVVMTLATYTDSSVILYKAPLIKKGDRWVLPPLKLTYPDGLYLAQITALGVDGGELARTPLTIHILSRDLAGRHPRLLFDSSRLETLEQRFREPRFQALYDEIETNAKAQREQVPVASLHYDLDQFPDENWLPTMNAWRTHFMTTGDALWWNALAYAFHGDRVAGEYARDVLLTLASWPSWEHPWQLKRGRYSEHGTGTWSHKLAEAYDLTFSLMTPDERTTIRQALLKNIVQNVHRMYVLNNEIIGNTSNWLAATVGGSLINIAAIYDDGPETTDMELYFTGALMKLYNFVTHVTDPIDGAWGESLGYNTYSFYNLSQSIPALKRVFNVDLSKTLVGSYNEYIWASNLERKQFYNFGDAALNLNPFTNWAFLVDMQKEPRLAWFYNYLKQKENLEDVLYDTKPAVQKAPFDENPDRIFHKLGTTVFKSGWGKDDFSFVMRTGAFFNHQHMDQGNFWLSDHGVTFIEERKGSHYYDDPLYQSWFIQPISHSTILIDGNHQSQRVGDEAGFAPGFDDHAFIAQALDGRDAAFTSGDIGKLYWGKIASLRRNVLFLKPRTLLMLDVASPADKDADVTLLYQTSALSNIEAGQRASTITKDGFTLHILHLSPEQVRAQAVETPHYLNTLNTEKNLVKEGMLTLTARTAGAPLVMANLLTTTPADSMPAVTTREKDGIVSGSASGKKFAFTTRPGALYTVENMQTNALAITWNSRSIFAAMGTTLRRNGSLLFHSDIPATVEWHTGTFTYDAGGPCTFTIGVPSKPAAVRLDGSVLTGFTYNREDKTLTIVTPRGQGTVTLSF
ncbi:MAG TPA: heparinase II/III family protein [Puia sp.]|nr:heparinase II/III family protein [Puia sp.]